MSLLPSHDIILSEGIMSGKCLLWLSEFGIYTCVCMRYTCVLVLCVCEMLSLKNSLVIKLPIMPLINFLLLLYHFYS